MQVQQQTTYFQFHPEPPENQVFILSYPEEEVERKTISIRCFMFMSGQNMYKRFAYIVIVELYL